MLRWIMWMRSQPFFMASIGSSLAKRSVQFYVFNWTDFVVELLREPPHVDLNKRCRFHQDWDTVIDEGEIYLEANGIEIDRELLKGLLPNILGQTEFKVI